LEHLKILKTACVLYLGLELTMHVLKSTSISSLQMQVPSTPTKVGVRSKSKLAALTVLYHGIFCTINIRRKNGKSGGRRGEDRTGREKVVTSWRAGGGKKVVFRIRTHLGLWIRTRIQEGKNDQPTKKAREGRRTDSL
jgi:hypothetical protein